MFKKLYKNLRIAFASIFYGMKGANDKISEINDLSNTTSVSESIGGGGVFSDLTQHKLTQDVKETRDAYYRVLNEADKYFVNIDANIDENGDIIGDLHATARKKTAMDFVRHCSVDESDGNKLRVIQDNKAFQKQSNFGGDFNNANLNDFDTLLNIVYDDFIPSFRIEKYCTKIVVKNIDEKSAIVDLYLPTMASQFGKIDAILVGKLHKIFNHEMEVGNLFRFKSISFVSEKAWGVENLMKFEYDNIKYKEIVSFDGNFVVRFEANIVCDGESITAKYETEELTEKYNNKAPKKQATDIFAIQRSIDGLSNGLETQKLDLK